MNKNILIITTFLFFNGYIFNSDPNISQNSLLEKKALNPKLLTTKILVELEEAKKDNEKDILSTLHKNDVDENLAKLIQEENDYRVQLDRAEGLERRLLDPKEKFENVRMFIELEPDYKKMDTVVSPEVSQNKFKQRYYPTQLIGGMVKPIGYFFITSDVVNNTSGDIIFLSKTGQHTYLFNNRPLMEDK